MPKSNASARLSRLDRLEIALQNDAPTTVEQLARSFDVSIRTISRDLSLLRDRGLPIDSDLGRGGGVRLQKHWGEGRIRLDVHECLDLLVACAVAERQHSPLFVQSLGSIKRKLLATMPAERRAQVRLIGQRILIGADASTRVQVSLSCGDDISTKVVRRAFAETRICRIDYVDEQGRITQRLIEPHYLLINTPASYALAFDHLRNERRCFRMDRIHAASLTEDRFKPRKITDTDKLLATLPRGVRD